MARSGHRSVKKVPQGTFLVFNVFNICSVHISGISRKIHSVASRYAFLPFS